MVERFQFLCRQCGGADVTRDAWAEWSVKEQEWQLRAAYDDTFCHDCERETKLIAVELEPADS